MKTYVVRLGKSDKVLDSQRVVRVLVWMQSQGHSAILLADGLLVSVKWQVQDRIRVERLQTFNT